MSSRDLQELLHSVFMELTELRAKIDNLELTCKKTSQIHQGTTGRKLGSYSQIE